MNDNRLALTVSYLTLRRAIGLLGMALPIVLIVGNRLLGETEIEPSISDYYYTGMRDVFVGTLCCIGVFLWSYRGYAGSLDNTVGNIAGIGAIGTALIPTTPTTSLNTHTTLSPECACDTIVPSFAGTNLHVLFAALCLTAFAYFCLFLFTKSSNPHPGFRKLQRNRIYRACGIVILICMALIAIYWKFGNVFSQELKDALDAVFWLEFIALFAFGFAWFIKGETLFQDSAD